MRTRHKDRLPGVEFYYRTGCHCGFCQINKCTYQRMVRNIYGRPYETTIKELYI